MKKPVRLIMNAAAAVCVVLAVCFMTGILSCRDKAEGSENFSREEIDALREKFPEYFGLDTFKGLEVYVWQMAPGSYSFGVMSGTNREKTFEELMGLKGVTAEELRAILSTYDIPEDCISVIPWQNPLSSYIAGSFISLAEKTTGELFDTIMSSPSWSSNSQDYLDAHEAEHRQLLSDVDGTLSYIFDQFLNAEKKGVPENGLRGVLMRTILDELAPESVLDLAAAPQDYFSAWKDMAIKQKEALGEKRLQKDYPAEHLLLQIMGDITP